MFFGSTKDEGAQGGADLPGEVDVESVFGFGFEEVVEFCGSAEHAGVGEFEDGPDVAEVVFDGSPCEGEAVLGFEKSG